MVKLGDPLKVSEPEYLSYLSLGKQGSLPAHLVHISSEPKKVPRGPPVPPGTWKILPPSTCSPIQSTTANAIDYTLCLTVPPGVLTPASAPLEGELDKPTATLFAASAVLTPSSVDLSHSDPDQSGSEATAEKEGSNSAPLQCDKDGTEVKWKIHARRVKGTDRSLVSPPFTLPGSPGVFKLMLLAKATSGKWGGASFKSAQGKGIIYLKCEEPDAAKDQAMTFEISVDGAGGQWQESHGKLPRQRQRFIHNFADKGVCEVINKDEEWNFWDAAAADNNLFFCVCLKLCSMEGK